MAVCAKLVPGLGEVMRAKGREKTARAVLSRAWRGTRADADCEFAGQSAGRGGFAGCRGGCAAASIEVLRGARHD